MSIADALAGAGAKPAGKRPYFLKPEVERILAITMAVAQELAVARQRVDTLERLLVAKGVVTAAETARWRPRLAACPARQPDPFNRVWGEDSRPTSPYRAQGCRCALPYARRPSDRCRARVCRADGIRLRNVFAGGGAARDVSGPSSWGYRPAMGLCAAITLGRIAGDTAAH